MKDGKPDTLNILGIPYKVTYCDKSGDIDPEPDRGVPLIGNIDYWKQKIKIYDNGRPIEDIWQTIIHETLHGIAEKMHLKFLQDCEDNDLDLLALALNDFLFRNGLIKLEGKMREEVPSEEALTREEIDALLADEPETIKVMEINEKTEMKVRRWAGDKIVYPSPVLEPTEDNPSGVYWQIETGDGIKTCVPGDFIVKYRGVYRPCPRKKFLEILPEAK
jgi:hypothetical protein